MHGIANTFDFLRSIAGAYLSAPDQSPDPDIDDRELPPGPKTQRDFERAVDELTPMLKEFAVRSAVTSLISPSRVPKDDRVAEGGFFATHYSTTTYRQWVRHWLARFLYAISRPLIGWRVRVGMDAIKQMLAQTSDEDIQELLQEVTESLYQYADSYNEQSPKEIDLEQLCQETEARAIQIIVPWGLRRITTWFARSYKPLHTTIISSLEDYDQEHGIVHRIHCNLTPLLEQAQELFKQPAANVDLSQRSATPQVESAVAKNIQDLLPEIIKLLRHDNRRYVHSNCSRKKQDMLLRHRPAEEKEIDELIDLEGLLEDEAIRTLITELLLGSLTAENRFNLAIGGMNKAKSALKEKWTSREQAEENFQASLTQLARTVDAQLVPSLISSNATADIDAAAADCKRLVAEVEAYTANSLVQFRHTVHALLSKIDTDRTALGAHRDYDDDSWDSNAYCFYADAVEEINNLPPAILNADTPLGESLREMRDRLTEAQNLPDTLPGQEQIERDQERLENALRCDVEGLYFKENENREEVPLERLLIRFNEVEIGRLVKLSRAQLNEVQDRSDPAHLHALLKRAKHAISWLKNSNIAAFQKAQMTERGQEALDNQLERISDAHRRLDELCKRFEQIQDRLVELAKLARLARLRAAQQVLKQLSKQNIEAHRLMIQALLERKEPLNGELDAVAERNESWIPSRTTQLEGELQKQIDQLSGEIEMAPAQIDNACRQLDQEALQLLEQIAEMLDKAQLNSEELERRSTLWANAHMLPRATQLVWRFDKVKKYCLSDPLNGLFMFVKTPSHLKELARLSLHVGVKMLRKVDA